jgi:hypothetical protein
VAVAAHDRAGASLSLPTVDHALDALEDSGFLEIDPPRKLVPTKNGVPILRRAGGRERPNRYVATLPESASAVRSSEWERARETALKSQRERAKEPAPLDTKAVESGESGALRAAASRTAAAASAKCETCGVGSGLHTDDCQAVAA